jgi:glycerophosphoryl diester phosphodiesterase
VTSVTARFDDPAMPMLVVAHRACHNPAPRHGLPDAMPENSIAAVERCIVLGVDLAEVDVRRTSDGYLILMHDDSVDRTTDGRGKIADLSLAAIQALRLRSNEGGPDAAVTALHVPTLDEVLRVARGRILLNLDVQAGLYADTIAAVRRSGQQDQIVVKQPAGTGSPVLADTPPFDIMPFMPIPALPGDLPAIVRTQIGGRHRPVAIELPRLSEPAMSSIAEVTRPAKVRLWVNTLWEGFVAGVGGDEDALRDPDRVWGRLRRDGVTIIQTDEPEALLRYLGRGSATPVAAPAAGAMKQDATE